MEEKRKKLLIEYSNRHKKIMDEVKSKEVINVDKKILEGIRNALTKAPVDWKFVDYDSTILPYSGGLVKTPRSAGVKVITHADDPTIPVGSKRMTWFDADGTERTWDHAPPTNKGTSDSYTIYMDELRDVVKDWKSPIYYSGGPIRTMEGTQINRPYEDFESTKDKEI